MDFIIKKYKRFRTHFDNISFNVKEKIFNEKYKF